MPHKRKSILLSGFALLALGASVIAVTADSSSQRSTQARPVVVNPVFEPLTAGELARRPRAIPQPTGKQTPGQSPITPVIANPQR
jgi:hypothetical protein